MPKVSIVIPAYNAMQYCEATLNSALQQTFVDFEVLIINDGSKDNILEWASKIEDERVKLISQENKGLSGARNTGITHAKGDYIAFLDADDLWEKTKLEKQVKYLDNNLNVGLLSTKVKIIDEHDQYLREFKVPEKEHISLEELLSYNFILCGSTPIVRRECFEKVGVFDCNLSSAADWDMWIRIALHYPVAAILESLVLYRKHSTNMSKDIVIMVDEIGKIVQKFRMIVPRSLRPILDNRYTISNLNAIWAMAAESRYRKAIYFSGQAFKSNPTILFSRSFLYINFLIFIKLIVPAHRYTKLRRFFQVLKRSMVWF
ncbi:glycosyltransferase family 2 protein [Thermocoleostomius sinensis]|uniref:Glycosyltransferase n=1 Tax=Thermocoleostomius sinensis A174 TaxID=2016057 RepID=A0A9E8Z8E0_9CYAN|nr:glycosyltransferase [Thermocoleostomius sinensis]WAL58378.1 glycosyltransferase [Thermocoleostomius sinensis A174]